MSKTMLIDGNSCAFAAQTGTKLHVGEREVQGIFGTLKSLRKLADDYPGYTPMMLWDGNAQWRRDIYPPYKGNRDKNEEMVAAKESIKDQSVDLKAMIYLLGVRQMAVLDAEADDIAGLLSVKLVNRGGDVLLVTGDKDWIQLINDNCRWFDPIRNRHCSISTITEMTGYSSTDHFLQAKALTGDHSDNISGVGGIGDDGASKLLLTYGSVEKFFERADNDDLPEKLPIVLRRFANNEKPRPTKKNPDPPPMREGYYRNLTLMNLKNVPKPKKEMVRVLDGKYNEEKLIEVFEEFAFNSILKDFDRWISPFRKLNGVAV